ncbi:hypothetical protein ABHA52_05540 [Enterococcus faecium]|uniref:hypothetical protein n=1 Tax=Bacteria TaxID=2 RepID=UPI000C27AB6B|nr:hypothetical protein [Enterococcus faecium]EME8113398.1 hypothetical protein [Enterococcus faecium]MDB7483894.1 hypothetical protein [Enterococcus faecium]MDB7489022.1 hypothetical protein [Enterococcus faecium]MDB7491446.1 hypothetical protein [Enterococcus faecium]MDB7493991.1 hypothetical protein [Enterococcus faecium]
MNKKTDEITADLVVAWLNHESQVSTKGESISPKEIAQAYLDIHYAVIYGQLPEDRKNDD